MSEQELNQIIANNISSLLQVQGKSQSDLADYMDVSQATVSNWCKGIKIPRMNKIDMIAVFFKVKRSYILEEHANEYIPCQEDLPAILHLMEQLNDEGQEKVVEYAEGLIALGKYKKHGQYELGQKEA